MTLNSSVTLTLHYLANQVRGLETSTAASYMF